MTLKITVELTEQDVQEAVAAWMNNQPEFNATKHWEPRHVSIRATMEWRGNGGNETQVAVAKIKVSQ